MNFLLHIFLFIFLLIVYVNIIKHNTLHDIYDSNNIYNIDYKNNNDLQKKCDKNKILIFDNSIEYIDKDMITNIDIKLKNTNDENHILVPFNVFEMSLNNNTNYTTQNFIDVSGITISKSLFPINSYSNKLNIMGGSKNYISPTYFHTYHRKFFLVLNGSVDIALKPLTQDDIIHKNMLEYEFSTKTPLWIPSDNHDISNSEVNTINQSFTNYESCSVYKNQIIFIPHNYCYSIKYNDNSILLDFSCHSLSSLSCNIHNIIIHYIQQYNVHDNNID